MTRPIYEIAREIRRDLQQSAGSSWRTRYAYAVPYLYAACELQSIDDDYGQDSGRSVVAYLLSNLTTWRGETARRLKAELNAQLKIKRAA